MYQVVEVSSDRGSMMILIMMMMILATIMIYTADSMMMSVMNLTRTCKTTEHVIITVVTVALEKKARIYHHNVTVDTPTRCLQEDTRVDTLELSNVRDAIMVGRAHIVGKEKNKRVEVVMKKAFRYEKINLMVDLPSWNQHRDEDTIPPGAVDVDLSGTIAVSKNKEERGKFIQNAFY
jgi:hypothetical protein